MVEVIVIVRDNALRLTQQANAVLREDCITCEQHWSRDLQWSTLPAF